MMLKQSKNFRLLMIWVVLLLLTTAFFIFDHTEGSRGGTNKKKYSFNTTDIASMQFAGVGFENKINTSQNPWTINDKFDVDAGMREVMQALFEQVRVQRTISGKGAEELISQTADTAVQVSIEFVDGSRKSFKVVGDFSKMNSYFIEQDEVHLVNIPGYQSYVAGMFSVSENDWRDRILFETHWQSLEYIKVTYPADLQGSFSLKYKKGLFALEGEGVMDTTSIMTYVEANSYQYADKYLTEAEAIHYDSLKETEHYADIQIKAFDEDSVFQWRIYPKPDDEQMHFALTASGEPLLVSGRRVAVILRKKSDFINKD